jgi:hypothetical protein
MNNSHLSFICQLFFVLIRNSRGRCQSSKKGFYYLDHGVQARDLKGYSTGGRKFAGTHAGMGQDLLPATKAPAVEAMVMVIPLELQTAPVVVVVINTL